MDYRQFYLGKLPSKQWENIFIYCLDISTKFKIHLPEKPEGYEREFYSELKTIQKLDIKPWKGCKQHIEIRGILDEKTKLFFKKYLYQSLHKDGSELCDYQFLNDYREILYVGDWTDRLILLSEKELEEIKQLEICFDMWGEHEVCPEMLDERKLLYNSISEDNDDFSLDINSISEAVSSFFNKLESSIEENKKELR